MNSKEEREALIKNRALGCLWGLVVGDALGAPFEFQPPETIDVPEEGEYTEGGHWDVSQGEWTDDSAMAMALADSLNEEGWDREDQMAKYLEWYHWGEYQGRGESYGVGNQTRRALMAYEEDGEIDLCGRPYHRRSAGNGSIMRLAPVPVWCALNHKDPDEAIDVAYQFGMASSTTTHDHSDCKAGAGILSALLCALIVRTDEPSYIEIWDKVSEYVSKHTVYRNLFNLPDPPSPFRIDEIQYPKAKDGRGGISGYVVDTFNAAVWCWEQSFLRVGGAKNIKFASTIRKAVSLGGDTDTVAAVAGQIAGATWGVTAIHPGWLIDLDKRKIKEAEDIFSTLVKNGKVPVNG